jgi:hypothetical protein
MLIHLLGQPLLGLLGFTPTTLGGSNSRMEDQAFKNSTTPASLSIFFSDPSADYKYSDIGSGDVRYISSRNVFYFSWEICRKRPSNSFLFQTARGSEATIRCTFPKSARHSKISRSATWLLSRKHSNEACLYSARPGETRRGFQDQPYSARGLVGT